MENPSSLKKYHSKTANEFADLMSIIEDLKEAAQHFEMAETVLRLKDAEDTNKSLEIRAFWISGLTLYGRVFKTGVRIFDRASIESKLRPDMLEFHQWLLNMRDKHTSHSVSPYEDSIATIGRISGQTTIGYFNPKYVHPSEAADINQCHRFVREVIKIADSYASVLFDQFRQEAESLSDEIIDSLPQATFSAPSPEKAGASRGQKSFK